MTDQNPAEQPAWQPPSGPPNWTAPGPQNWAAPGPQNWAAPGSLGAPKLDKYGNTLTRVLGDAGNVAIIIHIYVPARTDNPLATSVLQQQSDLLTAGSS